MATTVAWHQGMLFTATVDSGHPIPMDASESVGGENKGPRPKEMILAGLGGCTGMDVVSILRKMRQSWDRFEVGIEASSQKEHPRVYTAITMVYRIWGEVEPKKFQRAVTLSAERYCPVSAMLRAGGIAVTYRCEVNGAPLDPADPTSAPAH